MKKITKPAVYILLVCNALLLTNCSNKKVTDLKPTPPVDPVIVNAMYPVSQSISNGSNNYTFKYEYDKDNHLTKYARTDNVVVYNIGTNQVDQIVNEFASADQQLIHIGTTSFVYTLVGTTNTTVNFYNTAPTQVAYTYFDKDVKSGVTSSRPGGLIQFENGKAGLPVKLISADGGGYNYNYTYNDQNNLTRAEFVRLSGVRVGAVYGRISLTTFDDKPSPFSSVKGYWPASFPQSYAWNYALAFCKNNPKQVISESYNVDKNAFEVYEQDDFTYTYNDKGYPTQITINITYYNATTTHSIISYSYTYK